MSNNFDKLIIKSFGKRIYEKKVRDRKDLDEAFDDLRRKML